MVDEGAGLEGLLMGTASETVSESNEVFQERFRQAQQRIKQIKKDEAHDQTFDKHLARMIRDFDEELLEILVLLLNFEVPSLTIISTFSLVHDGSMGVVWSQFSDKLEEPKPVFEFVKKSHQIERISYWLQVIDCADKENKTLALADLTQQHEEFRENWEKTLLRLLGRYFRLLKVDLSDRSLQTQLLQSLRAQTAPWLEKPVAAKALNPEEPTTEN